MLTQNARIEHALNVLIPDMRNGCAIQTTRGDLILHERDAEQIAQFMREMYLKKLQLAVQLDGCVYCED